MKLFSLLKGAAISLFLWSISSILSLHMAMGKPQHPNILFIMVDDLRPALGCYGDQLAVTPSLDALSIAGVTFSSAFAQEALCGPSRTSLLTSRRPDSTRIVDAHHYWRDYHNFTSLPQHFKEHGYYTASAGKIFHPGRCSNYSDDSPYSWSAVPYHPSTQQYKNNRVCGLHKNMTNIVCPVELEDQPEGTLPDLQTTHYAISFLQHWKDRLSQSPTSTAAGSSQPFFLAVGYHKPHIPLKFPRQFLEMFPLSSVPLPPDPQLPAGLPPVAYNPWNDLRWRDDIAALKLTFPYQAIPNHYSRMIRQAYYAATAYTDLLIGDLLSAAYLLHPDTLVVVMGDHGWSLGEHQEWSKFSNYEVATRVPLLMAPLSRYRAAKTALLADKSNAKYFRYKKYIKLQKKILKDIEKWAGNDAHKYSRHWVYSEQPNSFNLKSKVSLPFIDNDDQKYSSVQYQYSSKSRNEDSEKLRKSYTFHSNSSRSVLNKRDSFNDQIKIDKLEKHSHHHHRKLAHLMKRASRTNTRMKMSENDSNKIWLNLKKNFTYDGLVELLDVFPTLADLAGISQVPSCDSSPRTMNIHGFTEKLIRKLIPLRVPTRYRRRNGKKKTRKKWQEKHFRRRFCDQFKYKYRKSDIRRILIEKLYAAMKRSSKMVASSIDFHFKKTDDPDRRQVFRSDVAATLKSESNFTDGNISDTVKILDVTNIEEYSRENVVGLHPNSIAYSDQVYEKTERRLSPAAWTQISCAFSSSLMGVSAYRRGQELWEKRVRPNIRKPSTHFFRSDLKQISTREVRLCTEGQSLVPLIVDQVFVNSNSVNYVKRTSRQRYFQEKELATGGASGWNYTNLRSRPLKGADFDIETASSRTILHTVLRSDASINVNRSEDRNNVVSGPGDSDTWTATPKLPWPATLVNTNTNMPRSEITRSFASSSGNTVSCMTDVVRGRLAISQYPRPSFCPSRDPDSDQPRLKDIHIMGYSLLSRCYRYTLWVTYNSTSQTSNFDEVLAEELYDHLHDPREDHNLLSDSPRTKTWPSNSYGLLFRERGKQWKVFRNQKQGSRI
ncbi:Sulfatase N-terminal [Trinorchestia longiramus]|nr:Sulfatase N-terminal [Trinorchestia longiramus]